jgi:hypothetical protein
VSEYKIKLLAKARKEFLTAVEWYEEQKDGLGGEFIKEIEQSLNLTRKNPNHYPLKINHFNEFVVKKYPYILIYKITSSSSEIIITSIFHAKRNPTLK